MEEHRVSSRPTKGVPPVRFGDRIPEIQRRPHPPLSSSNPGEAVGGPMTSTPFLRLSVPDPARPKSVKSSTSRRSKASSSTSTSSAVRLRLAELQAAEKIAKAEEEADQKEMERARAKDERERLLDQKSLLRKTKLEEMRLEVERMKEEFEEDADLSDHSQLLSEDEEEKENPQNQPASRPLTPTQPNMNLFDAVTCIAQNMAQLTHLSLSAPQKSDGNKQFLARQTMGKDLPYFSGQPEEWPCFVAEFERTTELCGFSNVENMVRLRKCLKGKAREAVQAALAVPDNTNEVIDMLRNLYGRPDLIVKTLIQKARESQPIKEGKPEALLSFSNSVRNLSTTMALLGRNGHNTNPQLLEELVKKLPYSEQSLWIRSTTEKNIDEPTVSQFSEWLQTQARALSKLITPESSSSSRGERDKTEKKQYYSQEKPIFVVSDSEHKEDRKKSEPKGTRKKTKPTNRCTYCDKPGHIAAVCRTLIGNSVPDRWDCVKEKKLCYSCLGSGHGLKTCRQKKECDVDGCDGEHSPLLHKPEWNGTKSKETENGEDRESTLMASEDTEVLLRVLTVKVKGPLGTVTVPALLDGGSSATMIDADLAAKIGATGPKRPFTAQWMTDVAQCFPNSEHIEIEVSGTRTGDKKFKLSNVRTVENLALPTQTVNVEEMKRAWEYLEPASMESLKSAKPLLLIGQRHWGIITAKKVLGQWNGPAASKTPLGWVIHGNVPRSRPGREFSFFARHQESSITNEYLHELMKQSFRTEDFGVKLTTSRESDEDERSREIMKKTTRRVGVEWETGLLWKNDDVTLPESKSNALRRLVNAEKKMDRDGAFSTFYHDKIKEYVDKGFARKLTPEETATGGSRIWYLPHFGVVNPNKPGKVRFVFDAAAKSHGFSLNDFLLTGPDLYNSLPGVLWKFREKKIAFGGDIRDMFHRIKIQEADRPSQRFLWRGDRRKSDPDVYEMTSMTFGATCSPSSAMYVMRRNAEEFREEFPKVEDAVRLKHYMDDYLDCADTTEEALTMIQDVTEVHRRGSFQILKWISSSPEVLMKLPAEARSGGVQDINFDSGAAADERVLGMYWNPRSDEFSFNLRIEKVHSVLKGKDRPSKREVLRVVMSIFDPFGFLANLVVQAKILMQEIWTTNIGWDDQITDDLNQKWQRWKEELEMVRELKIPRWYEFGNEHPLELHIFCDASEKAFASVAYLKTGSQVKFVSAKTRVAPLKPMSIPRLELQAAVMASRLSETIVKEHSLEINRQMFWSDSITVLKWIRSDARRYQQFVAHRVGEILEKTTMESWKWVPTKENVADEATKWSKPFDFDNSSRWMSGPEFLRLPETQWPTEDKNRAWEDTEEMELRLKPVLFSTEATRVKILPDISRFSNWSRLIRSTAWVLRYVRQCLPRTRNNPAGELTPEELQKAELLWIQQTQEESFPEDLRELKGRKELKPTSKLFTFTPKIDKIGIVRVGGRIDGAKEHYHEKSAHQGQERTLNELRQKYWVIHGRQAVRRAAHQCQVCKIRRAMPTTPKMGSLPDCRLAHSTRPFTHTGVDYFGPMEITVGRRHEKRYGALFTCLVTRAIHLEVAHSLSTDSFIMALRRFTGRRGQPMEIWSDNGTNFVGAEAELKKALAELKQSKIEAECSSRGTNWHFIPPKAPHMGGSWERMVRSVKTALRVTLKERAPKDEILRTLFVEAESLVNSHPLTHVSLDHRDDEALTPNHFLLGSSSSTPAPGTFDNSDLCLRKQWRTAQRLTDMFWQRWLKEFLPTLTRRTKWYKSTEPVKLDDPVFIMDEDAPRSTWIRGIVTGVIRGKDGVIRSVDIKTSAGVYRRPVVKVIVLDVQKVSDPASKTGGGVSTNETTHDDDGMRVEETDE